jgi:DNA (cytosine-5)-methyltransferase 1
LEACGYAFGCTSLCAASISSPHIRQRLFWVGHANHKRLEGHTGDGDDSRGASEGRSATQAGSPVGGFWADAEWLDFRDGKKRPVQPGLRPMAPRSPAHVGLCSAYGNAIVAPLATEFIKAFMEIAEDHRP